MEICLIENRTLIKDKVEVAKTLNKYFVSSCGLVSNFDVIVLAIRENVSLHDESWIAQMSNILKSLNVNKMTIKSLRYGEPCLYYLGGTRRAAETSSYPPNQEFLKKTAFQNRKSKEISRNVSSACGRLRPPFELLSPRLEHRTRLTRACGSNGKTATFSISPPP